MTRGGKVLTPRECEVLQAFACGGSARDVGEALGISRRTVQFHVVQIFGALGVNKIVPAVLKGIAVGLIENPYGGKR